MATKKRPTKTATPSRSVPPAAVTVAATDSATKPGVSISLTPSLPGEGGLRLDVGDMERLVGFDFIRATECAALSAYKWLGKGEKELADYAACDAIRGLFDRTHIAGTVTIGEGIKDNAPGIFKGERLGTWTAGAMRMAIALDPIDGTTSVSKGLPGAIAVIAAASCDKDGENPHEMLADIPSFYMQKLSIGPKAKEGPGRLRLDNSVQDNLEILALKLGKRVADLTVTVLDRPRHEQLIRDIRHAGAAIRLLSDGDIAAAIAPSLPGSGVDLYIGTGGSPEAVLAAAALKCVGGEILARMWPRDDAERKSLAAAGITQEQLDRVYTADDLARGDRIMFAATGISDSSLLKGIRISGTSAETTSVLMRARHRTVRYIQTQHDLDYKKIPLRSESKKV